MALFATEIPAYYDELLSKTGGKNPSPQSKAACWALVTKLLRTIFKEVHKVRRFASEAVSLGADSLHVPVCSSGGASSPTRFRGK